jgi:membrane protease YdiL (CAAX protease family)
LNTTTESLHGNDDGGQPASSQISVSPPPAAQPALLRRIFIGGAGLRAGWSLLIFIALMAALLFGVNAVMHKLSPATQKPSAGRALSPRFGIIAELPPFLGVLLITWIMSKIERRPNSVYGLGDRGRAAHFFAGLGWGVTCLSLLVLILWKTGLLVIDQRLLFGNVILGYGALWLLVFLLVGLLEEYLTRGYLLYTLARGLAGIYRWIFKTRHSNTLGFWTAAFVLSILFGLGHGGNPGESPIGLLTAGMASLVFCFSLWRTGSLWWAIGLHASWDWAQSFLFGVADSGLMAEHRFLATHAVGKPLLSGGTTGPEGSIFCLLILGLVVMIIVFTLPRGPGYEAKMPALGPPVSVLNLCNQTQPRGVDQVSERREWQIEESK